MAFTIARLPVSPPPATISPPPLPPSVIWIRAYDGIAEKDSLLFLLLATIGFNNKLMLLLLL